MEKQNGKKLLLSCGAGQVGKTHAGRQLGKTFSNFIEINLESNEAARQIIEKDLDVDRIILQLSELLQKKIEPGSTLLFFDEIQVVPIEVKASLSKRIKSMQIFLDSHVKSSYGHTILGGP